MNHALDYWQLVITPVNVVETDLSFEILELKFNDVRHFKHFLDLLLVANILFIFQSTLFDNFNCSRVTDLTLLGVLIWISNDHLFLNKELHDRKVQSVDEYRQDWLMQSNI